MEAIRGGLMILENKTKETVLITGGAGYIGSHTALEFIRAGYDVVVIDNLTTGFYDAIPKDARFYKGDIRDESFLNKVFAAEKIDIVAHLAAYSLVSESVADPLKYYDNNVYGTQVLLSVMKKNDVNKIIFASSAAVFGEGMSINLYEYNCPRPINPYGDTKLVSEKMINFAADAYDLHYVILRFFNVCGADRSGAIGEAHNPETHLIPLILKAQSFITVFGDDYDTFDGTCVRDYVHVTDVALA